jgi:hypothetical protein
MSTSAQQQPLDPIEAIGNVLVVEHGWRRRRGRQGRAKVRGRCLFHDDATPSADLYLDDGWYYCHACGDQYSLDEVARALGFDPGLKRLVIPQNDPRRRDRTGIIIAGLGTRQRSMSIGSLMVGSATTSCGSPCASPTARQARRSSSRLLTVRGVDLIRSGPSTATSSCRPSCASWSWRGRRLSSVCCSTLSYITAS